jgi:streptogramin lyase
VFAAGSLWVPMHFEHEVLRVDPVTLRVTARISVGLSPVSIVAGAGSLWVALQYGRGVARIDPNSASVVATVAVGRQANTTDGPAQVAYDGVDVLVSLQGSGRVAHVDPASQRVSYDDVGTAVGCAARVDPVPGGYWLDDTQCANSYHHWDATSRSIIATVTPTRLAYGAVVFNGFLYTAESRCGQTGCSHGWLVKRDATTGAVLAQRSAGVEDNLPNAAAGSLWTADFDASTLQRVEPF